MFTAPLFTVLKTWKWLKCLSMNEWIKKMGYTHMHTIMDYYIFIKKNKILPFMRTCVDLEGIMAGEVS